MQEFWYKGTLGKGLETRLRSLRPVHQSQRRARVKQKAKPKANMWTLWKPFRRVHPREQLQPFRFLQKKTSMIVSLSSSSNAEPWIMGVTVISVSSALRQANTEYVLLDSGAQLSRMSIQVSRTQEFRCLILESTLRVELDSNIMEEDW